MRLSSNNDLPCIPSMVREALGRSRFLRFIVGGAVTFTTTLVLMAFWHKGLAVPRLPGYALTHGTAFVVGFLLNRRWVFRATESGAAAQGARFAAAQVAFRGLDWGVFSVLEALLSPPVVLGILAANLLVLPLKYVFYRRLVFSTDAPQQDAPATPAAAGGWSE